jgi:SRSO17 transposase
MILPVSWAVVLEPLRPAFRRRGTFALFTMLATGMIAQSGRRSVVGMLAGARMAGVVSFHAACRFFSHAVWDVDRLGLLVARGIVQRLLDPDAPIVVVVDDTLFKRWVARSTTRSGPMTGPRRAVRRSAGATGG